ncbi:MAG: Rrf2 family transcriptional regulator [Clostridiales bacterium]|nr:Rrf2 family transcriptional regulator [Clostridiales bacterium]
MKISTKGRYALRMLVDMVQNQAQGAVALKEIAARQNISKKYLEQIALVLSQAGILHGSRGHQGGYRLVGQPSDYTVCSILETMEGSLHPVACLDHAPNDCERCNGCETLFIWEGLDQVIREYLSAMTLQDVLDRIEANKKK